MLRRAQHEGVFCEPHPELVEGRGFAPAALFLQRADLIDEILERFERILQKLGKDEGYTMIIEKAAVVYATPAVDLTARLIKEFNSGAGKEKGGKDSSGKCHMDCLSSKADCYKKCSSGSEACESACEPAFDSCDKNCD